LVCQIGLTFCLKPGMFPYIGFCFFWVLPLRANAIRNARAALLNMTARASATSFLFRRGKGSGERGRHAHDLQGLGIRHLCC
jgi:hypothetical protein